MFCSICLDTCQTYTVKMDGCIHHHCLNCFVQWAKVRNTCPMCRNENSQVSIFNADGKHIKNCLIANLNKFKPDACGICMKAWTSVNVRPVVCDHHHCLNCFVDWGRNECPTCAQSTNSVAMYYADGVYLAWCRVEHLQKTPEDTWLDSDAEEHF